MKINKAAASLVAGVAFLATSANAASLFILQAGSGHPHITAGTANWVDEWGAASGNLDILDGRTIQVKVPSVGNTTTKGWDTPIPVDVTNVNWSVKAFGANPNGDGTNRICSFTSSGVFSNCGATVLISPTPSASQVLVPTDGSAYSQSSIVSKCIAGGFCGVSSTLFHIKATQP